MSEYAELSKLIDDDPDEAVKLATDKLNENPDDALSLFVIAEAYSRAERFGLAANLYQRITQLRPDRLEPWNNLGMCYSGLNLDHKAREAFMQAHRVDPASHLPTANLAMAAFQAGDIPQAISWCKKTLAIEPESRAAQSTLSLCQLSRGEWEDGFRNYQASLGGKFRKINKYRPGDDNEPFWDGTPGKSVVVYGEQGIGDEIMFSSCILDAEKTCSTVILECDHRLTNLFKRSFPNVHVYGTRRQKEGVTWIAEETIDYSIPIGQLPQFFRKSPQDCPGMPYLTADPERRTQWRALFDSWGPKPKIGICWSGGTKANRLKERAIGLQAFKPLFEAIDADWVSLQYKDPTKEIRESGFHVKHFKRACETDDYDDTAALIAELDMVIGVHTAAHHMAGALGVPGIVLVPSKTIWIYELDSLPWYRSATLCKQKKGETWPQTLKRLANDPCLGGLRSQRGGGVPRLHPVADSARNETRIGQTDGVALAA
jgi:Tfp pilus assembly protein PilF